MSDHEPGCPFDAADEVALCSCMNPPMDDGRVHVAFELSAPLRTTYEVLLACGDAPEPLPVPLDSPLAKLLPPPKQR